MNFNFLLVLGLKLSCFGVSLKFFKQIDMFFCVNDGYYVFVFFYWFVKFGNCNSCNWVVFQILFVQGIYCVDSDYGFQFYCVGGYVKYNFMYNCVDYKVNVGLCGDYM